MTWLSAILRLARRRRPRRRREAIAYVSEWTVEAGLVEALIVYRERGRKSIVPLDRAGSVLDRCLRRGMN